ncbi:hypothetical protein Srufu_002480 [Streptomyces libani subsp. rufus]|nr:hypothetical protein Srufu_002480 [Streptomyces libani subsp. rufus]
MQDRSDRPEFRLDGAPEQLMGPLERGGAAQPALAQALDECGEPLGRRIRVGPGPVRAGLLCTAQQPGEIVHPLPGRGGQQLPQVRVEDGGGPQLAPGRAVLPDLGAVLELHVVVLNTPAKNAPRNAFTAAYEQARGVLDRAVDARGKRIEVVELPEPADFGRRGKEFLACYVNYYVANGAVVMPRFGDRKADGRAAAILREQYPGRKVVQVPVDNIGEGGGGIHCSTQQLPTADGRSADPARSR